MAAKLSVGVITCNEEQTIGPLLKRLCGEAHESFQVTEIIVVSAECRDDTDATVRRMAARDRRIRLIVEPKRRGKSAAVNTFLAARGPSDLTLLTSGDVLPEKGFLTSLVGSFADAHIGMAGGRPIPVNSETTFLGAMAHTMWQLHHDIASNDPKLGEAVMFRSSLVEAIPDDSPVDEASIEALVLRNGLRLCYVPEAILKNRGPKTVSEWFSQRRRIAQGHLWLRRTTGHSVSTGGVSRVLRSLMKQVWKTPRSTGAAAALVILEGAAKAAAVRDFWLGRQHRVWKIAKSTKLRIDE